MIQSVAQQFNNLVKNSTHILVLLPERPRHDFYCSAMALAHYCDDHGIRATIAFFDPYEETILLSFLPIPDSCTITHSISGSRDLILSFKTTYNKILNIRTETTPDNFNIYITPEKGMIDSRDFSFLPAKFPYDLIITIGAIDKEAMGRVYDEIPDIFYELPIVNIDNKSANEQFGKINIINAVASSVSEVVGDLLQQIVEKKITRPTAQCLLTGIVSETNSFQNHNTTPHALTLASTLIDLGADQQTIIKHLYRNQTFALLQLWGRAMKNLTTAKCHQKIILSSLTYTDLQQTRAEKHHIHSIVEKMSQNYPAGKIFVLLHEHSDSKFVALVDTKNAHLIIENDVENVTTLADHSYEITLNAHSRESAEDEICTIFAQYMKILG